MGGDTFNHHAYRMCMLIYCHFRSLQRREYNLSSMCKARSETVLMWFCLGYIKRKAAEPQCPHVRQVTQIMDACINFHTASNAPTYREGALQGACTTHPPFYYKHMWLPTEDKLLFPSSKAPLPTMPNGAV